MFGAVTCCAGVWPRAKGWTTQPEWAAGHPRLVCVWMLRCLPKDKTTPTTHPCSYTMQDHIACPVFLIAFCIPASLLAFPCLRMPHPLYSPALCTCQSPLNTPSSTRPHCAAFGSKEQGSAFPTTGHNRSSLVTLPSTVPFPSHRSPQPGTAPCSHTCTCLFPSHSASLGKCLRIGSGSLSSGVLCASLAARVWHGEQCQPGAEAQ